MRDPRITKEASRFDKVVNSDPIGVNKFAKGRESDGPRKNVIYGLLFAIPLFLVVSLIFFGMAHIEGNMMEKPE